MDRLTMEDWKTLVESSSSLAVSLLMPTHRYGREVQQSPTRLKNLIRQAEQAGGRAATDELRELLEPARRLVADTAFWQHQGDGLALYLSHSVQRHFRVSCPLPERVFVGESFLITPLLPLLATADRFHVLALSLNRVRLLEASPGEVREVDPGDAPRSFEEALGIDEFDRTLQARTSSPAGLDRPAQFHGHGDDDEDRLEDDILFFFRRVATGIRRTLTHGSPLVLATVDRHFPLFRRASDYSQLVAEWIPGNPDRLSDHELRDKAVPIVERFVEQSRDGAVARYSELVSNGRTSRDPAGIVRAAQHGRVEQLFVAVGEQLWGRFDAQEDRVDVHARAEEGDEDLLNLAAARTLLHRGAVHALDRGKVPEHAPVAAILRY